MTTVLVIVAVLLVGSAIWGFRIPGRGKQARVSSETLARRNLPHVEPSSLREYIPLGVLFLCLLVFDTETREQRTLLCILTLAAAFLLWFGRGLRVVRKKAEFRDKVVVREANIPGGNVKIFDDASIELQTAAGTKWFRSFAELEHSLRASDGLKPPLSV
jgi:hypothetical protein